MGSLYKSLYSNTYSIHIASHVVNVLMIDCEIVSVSFNV